VLLLANWWLLKQKRLMKRNTEMFNTMAHELRTPLTNIQLAAGLLNKKGADPGNRKFIDIISQENSRLIEQVERVLHLARIDHGHHPFATGTAIPSRIIGRRFIVKWKFKSKRKVLLFSWKALIRKQRFTEISNT
jgi:signal transduction histidine kinase